MIDKDSKLLSKDACDTLVKKTVPIQLVYKSETCSSGCYLFNPKTDVNLTSCPVCNSSRTKTSELKTVKIADKLAELLSCEDIREKLSYRHDNYSKNTVLSERNSSTKIYKDAFDGDRYAELVQNGCFDNKYDIALKIDIDGFRSKVSNTKMILVHCVVLNYDISEVNKIIFFLKKNPYL